MHKLSDTVERKFVNSIDITEWEIETDSGWEDVTAIHKTVEYVEWNLVLSNGMQLTCADNHIVFRENMEEVFVKNLVPGDEIMTRDGPVSVQSVVETNQSSHMFDVTVNSPNHRFYSAGILSHNTTTAVCIILHYILFNRFKSVALLANKGDAAREILDRIQTAYESLPKWIQQGVVEWNKGSVVLENGSKVLAASTSSSNIRGKSMNFVYIDETAFVEGWSDFYSSVFPTLSSGKTTKILFTSTPNGLNHFYKTCEQAQMNVNPENRRGKNGFIYIEVPWHKVPGRDDEWRDEILAGMDFDYQKFEVEFNVTFEGSSNTLISGAKLKELFAREAVQKEEHISVYCLPKEGANYVIVADVSRGKGLDYSAFQVIDITKMPYEQVATFRDNFIVPIEYAEVIHRIARYYNNAAVLVEVNDIGAQVSDTLFYDFGYENILFTENAGAAGKRITAGFGGKNVDRGIRTTKLVKNVGCSLLKLLLEQNQMIINDNDTIQELRQFSKKGPGYEAESGSTDDLVMCLVLFAWLSDQRYFRDLTDINTIAKLRDRTEDEMQRQLTPFGIIDDGQDDFEDVPDWTYRPEDWIL